ncbi:MAG TPA: hypothetical protein VGJ96_00860 [Gemmatimonadaceae bacterium]
MLRPRSLLVALTSTLVVAVACTDQPVPTEGSRLLSRHASAATYTEITAQIMVVFGTTEVKMPNTNSALQKFDLITKKLQRNTAIDSVDARVHTFDLIDFIRVKAYELADQTQVQALIDALETFAGITSDSFLVYPSDQPQTLLTDNGHAGLQLPVNPVTFPTLFTITPLDSTVPPLTTKLDQYPGYIEVGQQSADPDGNPLTGPVTVAVCAKTGIPDSIATRLRLGHQTPAGFVVTPNADASFLRCQQPTGVTGMLPSWMRTVASFVLPRSAYADVVFSGGVGGTAEAFSPFAPVDPLLALSGGVGGTAEAFIRTLAPSDVTATRPSGSEGISKRTPRANTVESAVLVSGCDAAVIGSALTPECRPRVELRTALGTVLKNVPVGWAIGAGDGSTAADDPVTRACGTFGTTAETTTNDRGKAGACWTLGMTAGSNTLVATPRPGGDAPAGTTFSPSSWTFTVTALKAAATVTVDCGVGPFVYTGAPLAPCTAVATGIGGLSQPLTPVYLNNTNAGTAAVAATFAGDANHTAATGTASFTIAPASSVVTVSCGGSYVYTGAPLTPCTATATGVGGLSQPLTPDYSSNTAVGTAGVIATFAGDANHTASSSSTTFTITKASSAIAVVCGGPYTYTGGPLTPCTASATGAGSLVAPLTPVYSGNTDAGTATVTASFAGDANHFSSSGAGSFIISPATPVLTWASPAPIQLGTPLSGTQLNASASYPNINPVAGAFAYTPPAGTVLPAGTSTLSVLFTPTSANFTSTSAIVSLAVRFVQVGCFASPVYSEMPITKSYQRKGSIVPIKCTLTNAFGAGVLNARGDLRVDDMGMVFGADVTPITVFSGANVFKVSGSGNYAYGLDTSPSGFLIGHYYHVTATWSDGSRTLGWFYVK